MAEEQKGITTGPGLLLGLLSVIEVETALDSLMLT